MSLKTTKLQAILLMLPFILQAQTKLEVSTKNTSKKIPSTLWGLFFEDINRGADGGLYGEMVKNRSFDFPKPLTGWDTWPNQKLRDGIITVNNQLSENPNNPKYVDVVLNETDTVGLVNLGFEEGMLFKKKVPCTFTIRYKKSAPGTDIRVLLINRSNRPVMAKNITLKETGNEWVVEEMTITPQDSSSGGKLLVLFQGKGKLSIDRLSLFPTDTWQGRKNGLRADLVQKLKELNPGFLRFPGGCIVEGNQLVNRYQWKTTIGPLENRKLVQSIWVDDVKNRQTPDYMESMGLGFYEYFQLCEDLNTAPLPILNAGMSCQFDEKEIVPIDQLQPFIKDALDLIEFANGGSDTEWGRKRSELGHPAPFNMKYLGVGNENWGPQYAERLQLFTNAIKAKYPNIMLVNATGYSRNEPVFKYMDSVLRARKADIIDEHFYDTPEWFMKNATRYDSYDRKGPKIFVGEYAAQSERIGSQNNVNNLRTALSEACFMTGLERNADVVSMASYAPLFAHVTGWQWTPNLIWFNNEQSYNTPNYYVQKMFSTEKGTHLASISLNEKPLTGQENLWASAVTDQAAKKLIIKIVNMNSLEKTVQILVDRASGNIGSVESLSGGDLGELNSFDEQKNIKPSTSTFTVKGKQIELHLRANSLNVVKVDLK